MIRIALQTKESKRLNGPDDRKNDTQKEESKKLYS